MARVSWLHGGLSLIAFAVALVFAAEPMWIGVGAGAAVALANFRAMAGLLHRLTSGDMAGRSIAVGLLMLKLLLLGGGVLAILTFLDPNPIAFVAGLTLMPLSLLLVSAFSASAFNSSSVQSSTTTSEVQG